MKTPKVSSGFGNQTTITATLLHRQFVPRIKIPHLTGCETTNRGFWGAKSRGEQPTFRSSMSDSISSSWLLLRAICFCTRCTSCRRDTYGHSSLIRRFCEGHRHTCTCYTATLQVTAAQCREYKLRHRHTCTRYTVTLQITVTPCREYNITVV